MKYVLAAVLLLNCLVAGIVCISLQDSRSQYEEQAVVSARNICRVLDENISGTFSRIDIALQAVTDEAEHQLATGGIDREALNAAIIRQHSRLPELVALRATDAGGIAVYGPDTKVVSTMSLAHRDYYKLLRENPSAGMVISKPLVGGISGKLMIVFARRIDAPGNVFAGLVYAGLGIEYLTKKFEQLNIGAAGVVALLDRDLFFVARYPAPSLDGAELIRQTGSQKLRTLVESGRPEATYEAPGILDGIHRVYSYRRLSHRQPFYIVTGLATRDVLVGWRAEAVKVSLLWAIFALGTVASTWLISRSWLRAGKAERELFRTEQRFRMVIENASDLICTLTPEGILTYAAPNVASVLGYLPGELTGNSFEAFLHPDDIEPCRASLHRVLETGLPQRGIEYRVRHKNGEWSSFTSNASLLTDEATGERCYLAVGHDITARKMAEEALRLLNEQLEERVRERTKAAEKANEVLQTIIDCMSDWAWEIDAEGRFTYCSPKAERLLGYRSEEMLGGLPFALMDAGEALRARTAFEQAAAQKLPMKNLECRCIARDGRDVMLVVNAVPISGEAGALVGYRGVATDHTERRRAETSLRETYALLQNTFEAIPDLLSVHDRDLRVVYSNWRGKDYIPEEERASKPHCYACYMRRDTPCDPCPTGEVFRTGLAVKMEVANPYTGRISEVHAYPVCDASGAFELVSEHVRDITERKQAEETREKLESQLRHSQQLEAIGTLAGGIAHDFNNILSPIIGYAEMALDDLPEPHPARYDVKEILTASNRARELVKQILSCSRIGGRQLVRPVDISPIVKEALKLLRASLPSSIEIRQNIQRTVIVGDATQMHQVVVNLCTNAAHAMQDVGRLDVSLTEVALDENALRLLPAPGLVPGKYVRLSVKDTGSGMTEDTMRRIFEPYYTTKEVGKGTGLGLSVVHGIVKKHGGEVIVNSEPGKGSTFVIYIPSVEEEVRQKSPAASSLPRGDARILIVDDEPAIARLEGLMLERLGYRVTVKTSSVEALELFREDPGQFDLIFSDYTMPQMVGTDLARECMNIRPDIPIILCTGFSERITGEEAIAMGIRGLVIKPLDNRQLANLVKQTLDNSRP